MSISDYLYYDCESTGLPLFERQSTDPAQPRMGSFCSLFVDGQTGRVVRLWYGLMLPDGWDMPLDVTAIHGLTTEMLVRDGVSPRQMLQSLFNTATTWKRPLIRVGWNIGADDKFVKIEAERAGLRGECDAFMKKTAKDPRGDKPSGIDACHMARPICQLPATAKMKGGFKPPKLAEAAAFFFRESHKDGHSALADTLMLMRIHQEMLRRQNGVPEVAPGGGAIEAPPPPTRSKMVDFD